MGRNATGLEGHRLEPDAIGGRSVESECKGSGKEACKFNRQCEVFASGWKQ
jgi:hypothetical protein